MNIELTPDAAVFREGDREAGCCVLNDPFKPYFAPLRSPDGHVVTIVSPGDHRHHKGLMYALRCEDLNFWEENPGSGQCGVQEILEREALDDHTLRLRLLWREQAGSLQTYHEDRVIRCEYRPETRSFLWNWQTRRVALRDHRLIKSEWSMALADGRKINYHGLGIRLPWCWGHDGCFGIEVDGQPATADTACGLHAPSITWWGRIDGHWTQPVASVTLRQAQSFTWFVLRGGFPYLSVGPSNAEELDVREGQTFSESYEIEIADRT